MLAIVEGENDTGKPHHEGTKHEGDDDRWEDTHDYLQRLVAVQQYAIVEAVVAIHLQCCEDERHLQELEHQRNGGWGWHTQRVETSRMMTSVTMTARKSVITSRWSGLDSWYHVVRYPIIPDDMMAPRTTRRMRWSSTVRNLATLAPMARLQEVDSIVADSYARDQTLLNRAGRSQYINKSYPLFLLLFIVIIWDLNIARSISPSFRLQRYVRKCYRWFKQMLQSFVKTIFIRCFLKESSIFAVRRL